MGDEKTLLKEKDTAEKKILQNEKRYKRHGRLKAGLVLQVLAYWQIQFGYIKKGTIFTAVQDAAHACQYARFIKILSMKAYPPGGN